LTNYTLRKALNETWYIPRPDSRPC